MIHHLRQLCAYNQWANERMSGYLLEAGDAIADETQHSSFPTIRKTLYHVWDAQVIWYKRLLGESVNTWPSHHFNGSLQEALAALDENSRAFVSFTENLPENGGERLVEYHALDGSAFHNTVEEIIMHVMNHGTYHRGQLITMLRNQGFTAVGSTDMIRYYRESMTA